MLALERNLNNNNHGLPFLSLFLSFEGTSANKLSPLSLLFHSIPFHSSWSFFLQCVWPSWLCCLPSWTWTFNCPWWWCSLQSSQCEFSLSFVFAPFLFNSKTHRASQLCNFPFSVYEQLWRTKVNHVSRSLLSKNYENLQFWILETNLDYWSEVSGVDLIWICSNN